MNKQLKEKERKLQQEMTALQQKHQMQLEEVSAI